MAVTWRIESTEADANTGEITGAYWEASDYEIVEEGSKQVLHRGRLYGSEMLEVDSSSEDFIRWQDVTEENVLNWAKSALGAEKVTEIETEIARQITESKTPVVTYENPWESTPEPE
jgi:hypothetical protein